ncbi:hypothetical protein ACXR2W_12170 [Leucobacter sp. HY1908]
MALDEDLTRLALSSSLLAALCTYAESTMDLTAMPQVHDDNN